MSPSVSRRTAGFTLIELVIVIAVIAILAALLIPTILNQTENARLASAKSQVVETAKALARMRTDTAVIADACYTLANAHSIPVPPDCGTPAELPSCSTAKPGDVCWNGPYITQATGNDPWDDALLVTHNAATGSIRVLSYGPDKTAQNDTTPGVTTCLPAGANDDICSAQ